VPMSRIEYAGGRPLLQYRGELLPLKDRGGVLADLEAEGGENGGEMLVTVLIYGDTDRRGQRSGMVVRRVLDVSDGTLLGGDTIDGMDLALVKERVTMVHRESGAQSASTWQEVA
jgi:two-component system chemotaxis sensor kinase CheA